MRKSLIVLAVSGSLALSGCAGMSDNQKLGAVFGCGIGILATVAGGGKNEAGKALANCAIGAAAGFTLATLLDEREKQELADARMRAAETGQRVDWGGPAAAQPAPQQQVDANAQNTKTEDTHHHPKHPAKPAEPAEAPPPTQTATANGDVSAATGWVIPVKTYVASNGETCRELKEQATKGDKTASDDVTMCRAASGWVVNSA